MKEIFLTAIRVISSLIVSGALAVFSATIFSTSYEKVTSTSLSGSLLDFTDIVGLIFSFLFFTTFLLITFGKKVDWIISGLINILILGFFFFTDIGHLYFPIGIVLIALGLGWGVRKIFRMHN